MKKAGRYDLHLFEDLLMKAYEENDYYSRISEGKHVDFVPERAGKIAILTNAGEKSQKVFERGQPETSSIQLEIDQPMKESEIIVTKRTDVLSNRTFESFVDKALIIERGGRIEGRVNNRAIVMENELCSIVMTTARIRFKWKNERGETISSC